MDLLRTRTKWDSPESGAGKGRETFTRVVLACDQGLPVPEQPYFLFRIPSGPSALRMRDAVEAIEQQANGARPEQKAYVIYDVVRLALCGWGKMNDPVSGAPIEYDPSKLEEFVGLDEAQELFDAFRSAVRLSAYNKQISLAAFHPL